MRARLILIAKVLLLVSSIASASESKVTGTFRVGKTVISPKHAAAYRTRYGFDARKTVTELVLSENPFDIAGAVAALDPHTFRIRDQGLSSGSHIILWISEDGSVVMNATTVSQTMTVYPASTLNEDRQLKAELTENTPGRVAGRVYTPKPVKVNDDSYELDVTFSTDVVTRAVDAKLPAGGGEPGKALQGLLAAMAKKDGANVKRSLSKKVVGKLYDSGFRTEAANLEFAVEMLSAELPKTDMKVVGGDLQGDTAILEVEGVTEKIKAVYFIRMLKEGGVWTFDEAFMAGFR
jgi:hypothetical protein